VIWLWLGWTLSGSAIVMTIIDAARARRAKNDPDFY
jgi:hypothetical protein